MRQNAKYEDWHSKVLIVFTVYVPENSGLERFNYLTLREFAGKPVVFRRVRGEDIPALVEVQGGYGWTGNDLFNDYVRGKTSTKLEVLKSVPWPGNPKPKLCLLGPLESSLAVFEARLFSVVGEIRLVIPTKYQHLAQQYIDEQGWSPTVIFEEGQVDRQIRRGRADLAIDIVCTGKTIEQERLGIYDTLFDDAGLVLLTQTYIKQNEIGRDI